MYANDSFFTLTQAGQIGLAALSAGMGFLTLWLCWRFCAGKTIIVRLLAAWALLVGFLWLAPQIYYTYYVFLLDGLSWKNVIQLPPSPWRLLEILTFQEQANLSYHSQALLGWLLIAMAFLRKKKRT